MARSAQLGGQVAAVVDPWPMVRIGVARVLASAGLAVRGEADDPTTAARCVGEAGAALLVLGDGGGSGTVEAVTAVREAVPSVRILVLVADATGPALSPLLGAGVDGLVPRSASPEELIEAAGAVLAGERFVASSLVAAAMDAVAQGAEPSERAAAVALTTKEREVLAGLAQGRTNEEIARSMFVSGATVKTHLSHIYAKLGVGTRHEALARALALGLLG